MADLETVVTRVSPATLAGANADLGKVTRKTFYEANESYIWGGGFIFIFLFVWELFPVAVTLPKGVALFFTTPSDIFLRIYEMLEGTKPMFDGNPLIVHLIASAKAFSGGLGLSILVALPLGVVIGRSQTLNAIFDPFITAVNATPRLVFLPIIMIWFGIGFWTVTLVVFIGAVFPLLINTYAGVRNADKLLINVVRSFGANEWEINKLVVLPNSLPFIVAGLRLAIGRAILGIVVAEFFGGTTRGIGVIMVDAAGKFHVDIVFAGLVLFMVLSLIMTGLVKVIENRLSRWRPVTVKTF